MSEEVSALASFQSAVYGNDALKLAEKKKHEQQIDITDKITARDDCGAINSHYMINNIYNDDKDSMWRASAEEEMWVIFDSHGYSINKITMDFFEYKDDENATKYGCKMVQIYQSDNLRETFEHIKDNPCIDNEENHHVINLKQTHKRLLKLKFSNCLSSAQVFGMSRIKFYGVLAKESDYVTTEVLYEWEELKDQDDLHFEEDEKAQDLNMLCHGVTFNMIDITALTKRDFWLVFGYFRLNYYDSYHNKIIPKEIVSKCHSFYGSTNKYIVDVHLLNGDEFVVNGHRFYCSTMYLRNGKLLLLINPLNKETDYKLYYEWFCDDIHQKREKGIIPHTQNVEYPAFVRITSFNVNKYLRQKLTFYFYFNILQINNVEIKYEKNKYNYNINYEWKIDNKLLNKFRNAQQNEMFYSDHFGFGSNVVEMFYLIFIPKSNPYHNSVQSNAKLILVVPDSVRSNEYECKIKDDVDIHNGAYYDVQPTAYQIASYPVPTYYPPQNNDKVLIYYHDKVSTFTWHINLISIFESEGKNEDIKEETVTTDGGGEFIVESEGDYDTK